MSNIPDDTFPRVELGPVVGLRAVPELPETVRRRVARLSKHEWTEADWADLLAAQRIVAHNVAVRHGLHKEPNSSR